MSLNHDAEITPETADVACTDPILETYRTSAIILCQKLLSETDKAHKKYRAANIVDFFAMIPIIGIPFGFLRSLLLSDAGDCMDHMYPLCGELSDILQKIGIASDIEMKDGLASRYKGMMSDFMTPNYSPGNYMNDADQKVKILKKKLNSLLEQLKKQSGLYI